MNPQMYYIIRNNTTFGPYTLDNLIEKVERGNILKCDKITDDANVYKGLIVDDVLKAHRRRVKVRAIGSLGQQLAHIGSNFIFPENVMRREVWSSNQNLMLIVCIGLLPMVLGVFSIFGDYAAFYGIALYFSVIWGLFFYYLFKTRQVSVRVTLTIFFGTQIFVFIGWTLIGFVGLNPFYWFDSEGELTERLIYYILGVGFTEELVKASPLIILMLRAREPLVPQTFVYYGLMSGIAFGVYEGVQYQLTINAQLDYVSSFMANISRLTSLPFIHAIWAAIAGYFVSFALLYPTYKKSLLALAVFVPALLHGIYDVSCSYDSFLFLCIRVTIMILSVVLLMTYLRGGKQLQMRLNGSI